MNAKLNFASSGSIQTVAAAAAATVIALGMLSSVAVLFQLDGKPLERLAAAERACAHFSYLSERQVCMDSWLAASQPGPVARR